MTREFIRSFVTPYLISRRPRLLKREGVSVPFSFSEHCTNIFIVCQAPRRIVVLFLRLCSSGHSYVSPFIICEETSDKSKISVFRTSHRDPNINETSSYVDLAPLYGHNQAAQNRVRVRDGYGLLYPDTFAEDRLLLLPRAVCTILVLFSRNHNVRFCAL